MSRETLCWTCTKAYADKCIFHSQWHLPVPGWELVRRDVMVDNVTGHKRMLESYRVVKCPLYTRDPREDLQKTPPPKRETKRERQARFKRNLFAQAELHKQRLWDEHLERAEAEMR